MSRKKEYSWVKTSDRLPKREGYYQVRIKLYNDDRILERVFFFMEGHFMKIWGSEILEWYEKRAMKPRSYPIHC